MRPSGPSIMDKPEKPPADETGLAVIAAIMFVVGVAGLGCVLWLMIWPG